MYNLLKRISQIAQEEKITIGALERKIGASKGVLSRALQNGTDIQSKWVSEIAENYPNYSAEWLITGKGPMVNSLIAFANRISEIVNDLSFDELSNIAESMGLDKIELANFTNNFIIPSRPFDLVKFLSEYPEYNFQWIITGEGEKFTSDEDSCIRRIKEKVHRKNHPEYYPQYGKKQDGHATVSEESYSHLWAQIEFQNAQLKEKDSQIEQLLSILKDK